MPERDTDRANLLGQNTDGEDEGLAILEATFDPWTIASFESLPVQQGWRCLEVGAGSGSVALWLAEKVGSTGYVHASNLHTQLAGRLVYEIDSLIRKKARRNISC